MRLINGLLVTTTAALSSVSTVHAITVIDLFSLGSASSSAQPNPANTSIPGNAPAWIQPHYAAGGQVVGSDLNASFSYVWTPVAPTGINLGSGTNVSRIFGTSAAQQVGQNQSSGGSPHAATWNGSAGTFVDLTPTNYSVSFALGTDGTHQVGRLGVTPSGHHAAMWSGSADTLVDLHPADPTYAGSTAISVRNGRQVGYADMGDGLTIHALTWTGTADSFVDLNPARTFFSSAALGTNGVATVGCAGRGSAARPALWTSSTAASYVDLTPASGYGGGAAYDADGGFQVGKIGASIDGQLHAALWNGSATSFVDLNAYLPAGQFTSSVAYTITGNQVFGLATDTLGTTHAVVWTVPEPVALSVLGVAGILAARRRR